jgi:hypothetical protein
MAGGVVGMRVVRVETVVLLDAIKITEMGDRVKKNDGIIFNDTKDDGKYE